MPLAPCWYVARPLRINFPGAFYHVMARGNAKAKIYLDDRDNRRFLELLGDVHERFDLTCHAYCLVENHYHLVAETPQGNLSAAIRHLNGVYAQWWNAVHARCGHVFQGRFKAQLIQSDAYLGAVCRYVVLNARRAGLVRHPRDWPWSSYRAAAGLEEPPGFLTTALVHSLVAPVGRERPEHAFERFVLDAEDDHKVADAVRRDSRFIGEDAYWRAVTAVCAPQRVAGVPRHEYIRLAMPLADLFQRGSPRPVRNRAIRAASAKYGYAAVDIARHLDLHPETVRRLLRAQRAREAGNSLAAQEVAPGEPSEAAAGPAGDETSDC